jgi:hypothetical protein
MKTVAAGLARRLRTFFRVVFSEILMVSSSARNHTSDSWGRPSGPIVAKVAYCAFSRSR